MRTAAGLTALLALYAVTMFAGATLLFVVEPMVGKMILPLLGGTPAVWSTCLVFFQAALLGGYAYAHATTAWLGARRQALLHIAVLGLPLTALPLTVNAGLVRGGEASPVLDVLLLLSVSVGLPFLVVSATAPLLQKWFSETGHPAARDPYFLYAASNLGSMLALLAYPTIIEPRLAIQDAGLLSQTRLWTVGYLALAVLTGLCALALWRKSGEAAAAPAAAGEEESVRPSARRRLGWVALTFVPSSLLLGTTTYVTTDIAAIPLLWVLPLAIYLLSFIVAFGRWPAVLHRAVVAAVLPIVLVVLLLMVSSALERIWVSVLWHFALLFVVALACHGEVALDRPAPRYLTEYFLLISAGGVLGGLGNALIAPLVFSSLAEYPLAMVLACVLLSARRARTDGGPDARRAALLALGAALLALILYSDVITARVDFAFVERVLDLPSDWVLEHLDPIQGMVNRLLIYGPPLAIAFLLRRRPWALGGALAAVLLVAGFVDARNSEQIRQSRSFFGVLRIMRDRDDKGYTTLRHGTTLHGQQSLEPARRGEPLAYYHRQGPIGQLFAELDQRPGSLRIAVIGLGTGTLAAYARPGDAVTFYEIDRLVRDVALDRAYFTFVADARDRGAIVRVELGDARIRLGAVRQERPGERYDLIAVDAFSSDAIPVHLLTREALRLYLEMLSPGGIIAVHISNRYLDLEPVVANLAEDAGLKGRLIEHDDSPETAGAARSTWVLLAPTAEAMGHLARYPRWTESPLEPAPEVGVWTDSFHNVLAVFRWGGRGAGSGGSLEPHFDPAPP